MWARHTDETVRGGHEKKFDCRLTMKRARDALVLLVRGTVVDTPALGKLRVREHAVLGVDASGRIAFCEDAHEENLVAGGKLVLRDGGEVTISSTCTIRSLPRRGFVCPGRRWDSNLPKCSLGAG